MATTQTELDTPAPPVVEPEPQETQNRSPTRWIWRGVLAAFGAVLLIAGWSYVHALTAPGTDSASVRSIEWLRDHGGSGVVNAVERWWYSHHQPKKGGPPPAVLTHPPTTAPRPIAAATPAPQLAMHHLPAPSPIVPFATEPVPGEGVWHPVGRLVDGVPAVYATALRPDPLHTGLAAGLAWVDPSLVRTDLFAGVRAPGGSWAHEAPVPLSERPSLIAAFNSGFQLNASRGGYYAEGRTVRPLINGAASLVVDSAGRPNVAVWGRDVQMNPSVASVRQNLALIVDNGAPVAGLDQNVRGQWGSTLGNSVFVWRSGVGVTRDGALVYAAGNGLSVSSLARILVAAGAVRAMELDINSEWTHFFTYDAPDPTQPAVLTGTKLVPDMRASPTLYLQAESRDFFALFSRATP